MEETIFGPHKPSKGVPPEDVKVIRQPALDKLSNELVQSSGFMRSGNVEEKKKALAIYKSLDQQGIAGNGEEFARNPLLNTRLFYYKDSFLITF